MPLTSRAMTEKKMTGSIKDSVAHSDPDQKITRLEQNIKDLNYKLQQL